MIHLIGSPNIWKFHVQIFQNLYVKSLKLETRYLILNKILERCFHKNIKIKSPKQTYKLLTTNVRFQTKKRLEQEKKFSNNTKVKSKNEILTY